MARSRPATLRSIADQLGLHVSTVSRVLNGPASDSARLRPGTPRSASADSPLTWATTPIRTPTSLRTQRSNLIGVLVPRLSYVVLATICEGIEEAAAEHGLSALVTSTRDDPATQRARTGMMLDRRVDGLIFGDVGLNGAPLAEAAARGTPFVLVNRRSCEHPAVTRDDYLGGRLVADHLLSLGHEEVAVIAGEPHASTGTERTNGFVDRYREAGLPIPEARVVHSAFDTLGGHRAAVHLLAAARRPSALFAVTDFAAIGAMRAVRDQGLRVGEDVAVVGFNDIPLAAELPVPLTSVRSSMHEMGRQAAHLLARLLDGKPVETVRLPPALVARASSGRRGRWLGTGSE